VNLQRVHLVGVGLSVNVASSLYPNSCMWPQMLPPKYEEDTITQYTVMAHYVPL